MVFAKVKQDVFGEDMKEILGLDEPQFVRLKELYDFLSTNPQDWWGVNANDVLIITTIMQGYNFVKEIAGITGIDKKSLYNHYLKKRFYKPGAKVITGRAQGNRPITERTYLVNNKVKKVLLQYFNGEVDREELKKVLTKRKSEKSIQDYKNALENFENIKHRLYISKEDFEVLLAIKIDYSYYETAKYCDMSERNILYCRGHLIERGLIYVSEDRFSRAKVTDKGEEFIELVRKGKLTNAKAWEFKIGKWIESLKIMLNENSSYESEKEFLKDYKLFESGIKNLVSSGVAKWAESKIRVFVYVCLDIKVKYIDKLLKSNTPSVSSQIRWLVREGFLQRKVKGSPEIKINAGKGSECWEKIKIGEILDSERRKKPKTKKKTRTKTADEERISRKVNDKKKPEKKQPRKDVRAAQKKTSEEYQKNTVKLLLLNKYTFPKNRNKEKYQENLSALLEKISEENIFIITYELFKTYGFFNQDSRKWIMKSNVLIEISKGMFILTEDIEEDLISIGKLDKGKRYYFNTGSIEEKDKAIWELWNKLNDNPSREVKALFVGLSEKNAYLLLNTLREMYSPILYADTKADKRAMRILYLLGFLEEENIGKRRAAGYILKNSFARALKINGPLDRFKYGWECLSGENRKKLKTVNFTSRKLLGKLLETEMLEFDDCNTYLFNILIKKALIVEDENGKCFINRSLMKELGLIETDKDGGRRQRIYCDVSSNDGGKNGNDDNDSEIVLTIKKNLGPGIAKKIVTEIKKITGINITPVNVEKAKNQLLGKNISLTWKNLEITSVLAAYNIEIKEPLLKHPLKVIGDNIKAMTDKELNVFYIYGLLKEEVLTSPQVKENLSLPIVLSGLDRINIGILTSPWVPMNFRIFEKNKLTSIYEKELEILTLSHVEELVNWLNDRGLQKFYLSHKSIIKSPNTLQNLKEFEKYGLPEPNMRITQLIIKKNVKEEDIEAFLVANYLNSQSVYQTILSFNRKGDSLAGEMSLDRLKSLCRLEREEFKKIMNSLFNNSFFRNDMEEFFNSARGKAFKPLIEKKRMKAYDGGSNFLTEGLTYSIVTFQSLIGEGIHEARIFEQLGTINESAGLESEYDNVVSRRFKDQNNIGILAKCADGRIIGYLMVNPCGYIQYIVVSSQHQRKGVGVSMIEAAVVEIRVRGGGRLSTDYLDNVEQVVKFYKEKLAEKFKVIVRKPSLYSPKDAPSTFIMYDIKNSFDLKGKDGGAGINRKARFFPVTHKCQLKDDKDGGLKDIPENDRLIKEIKTLAESIRNTWHFDGETESINRLYELIPSLSNLPKEEIIELIDRLIIKTSLINKDSKSQGIVIDLLLSILSELLPDFSAELVKYLKKFDVLARVFRTFPCGKRTVFENLLFHTAYNLPACPIEINLSGDRREKLEINNSLRISLFGGRLREMPYELTRQMGGVLPNARILALFPDETEFELLTKRKITLIPEEGYGFLHVFDALCYVRYYIIDDTLVVSEIQSDYDRMLRDRKLLGKRYANWRIEMMLCLEIYAREMGLKRIIFPASRLIMKRWLGAIEESCFSKVIKDGNVVKALFGDLVGKGLIFFRNETWYIHRKLGLLLNSSDMDLDREYDGNDNRDVFRILRKQFDKGISPQLAERMYDKNMPDLGYVSQKIGPPILWEDELELTEGWSKELAPLKEDLYIARFKKFLRITHLSIPDMYKSSDSGIKQEGDNEERVCGQAFTVSRDGGKYGGGVLKGGRDCDSLLNEECTPGIKALEERNFSSVRITSGEWSPDYKDCKQVPFKFEGEEREVSIEEQNELSSNELRNFKEVSNWLKLYVTAQEYAELQKMTYVFIPVQPAHYGGQRPQIYCARELLEDDRKNRILEELANPTPLNVISEVEENSFICKKDGGSKIRDFDSGDKRLDERLKFDPGFLRRDFVAESRGWTSEIMAEVLGLIREAEADAKNILGDENVGFRYIDIERSSEPFPTAFERDNKGLLINIASTLHSPFRDRDKFLNIMDVHIRHDLGHNTVERGIYPRLKMLSADGSLFRQGFPNHYYIRGLKVDIDKYTFLNINSDKVLQFALETAAHKMGMIFCGGVGKYRKRYKGGIEYALDYYETEITANRLNTNLNNRLSCIVSWQVLADRLDILDFGFRFGEIIANIIDNSPGFAKPCKVLYEDYELIWEKVKPVFSKDKDGGDQPKYLDVSKTYLAIPVKVSVKPGTNKLNIRNGNKNNKLFNDVYGGETGTYETQPQAFNERMASSIVMSCDLSLISLYPDDKAALFAILKGGGVVNYEDSGFVITEGLINESVLEDFSKVELGKFENHREEICDILKNGLSPIRNVVFLNDNAISFVNKIDMLFNILDEKVITAEYVKTADEMPDLHPGICCRVASLVVAAFNLAGYEAYRIRVGRQNFALVKDKDLGQYYLVDFTIAQYLTGNVVGSRHGDKYFDSYFELIAQNLLMKDMLFKHFYNLRGKEQWDQPSTLDKNVADGGRWNNSNDYEVATVKKYGGYHYYVYHLVNKMDKRKLGEASVILRGNKAHIAWFEVFIKGEGLGTIFYKKLEKKLFSEWSIRKVELVGAPKVVEFWEKQKFGGLITGDDMWKILSDDKKEKDENNKDGGELKEKGQPLKREMFFDFIQFKPFSERERDAFQNTLKETALILAGNREIADKLVNDFNREINIVHPRNIIFDPAIREKINYILFFPAFFYASLFLLYSHTDIISEFYYIFFTTPYFFILMFISFGLLGFTHLPLIFGDVFPDRISKMLLQHKYAVIPANVKSSSHESNVYLAEALAHYALYKGFLSNRVTALTKEYLLAKGIEEQTDEAIVREAERMVSIADAAKREEEIIKYVVLNSKAPLRNKFYRSCSDPKVYTLSEEMSPFIMGDFFRDAQGKGRLLLKVTFYPEGEELLAIILNEEVRQIEKQISVQAGEIYAKIYLFLRANILLTGYKDIEIEIVTEDVREVTQRIYNKGSLKGLLSEKDIKVSITQEDKAKVKMMRELACVAASSGKEINTDEIRNVMKEYNISDPLKERTIAGIFSIAGEKEISFDTTKIIRAVDQEYPNKLELKPAEEENFSPAQKTMVEDRTDILRLLPGMKKERINQIYANIKTLKMDIYLRERKIEFLTITAVSFLVIYTGLLLMISSHPGAVINGWFEFKENIFLVVAALCFSLEIAGLYLIRIMGQKPFICSPRKEKVYISHFLTRHAFLRAKMQGIAHLILSGKGIKDRMGYTNAAGVLYAFEKTGLIPAKVYDDFMYGANIAKEKMVIDKKALKQWAKEKTTLKEQYHYYASTPWFWCWKSGERAWMKHSGVALAGYYFAVAKDTLNKEGEVRRPLLAWKVLKKDMGVRNLDGGRLSKAERNKISDALLIINRYMRVEALGEKEVAERKIYEIIELFEKANEDSVNSRFILNVFLLSLKTWEETKQGRETLSAFIRTKAGKNFELALSKNIIPNTGFRASETDDFSAKISWRFIFPVLGTIAEVRFLHLLHIKKIVSNILSEILDSRKGDETKDKIRVLDLGCGILSVPILSALGRSNVFYIGIDRDRWIIKFNKKAAKFLRRENSEYLQTQAGALCFSDNSIDFMIIASCETDWKEVNRVLKPGGLVLCTSRSYQTHIIFQALVDKTGFKKLWEGFSTPGSASANTCILANKPLEKKQGYIFGSGEEGKEITFENSNKRIKANKVIHLFIAMPLLSVMAMIGIHYSPFFLYAYPFLAAFVWSAIKIIQMKFERLEARLDIREKDNFELGADSADKDGGDVATGLFIVAAGFTVLWFFSEVFPKVLAYLGIIKKAGHKNTHIRFEPFILDNGQKVIFYGVSHPGAMFQYPFNLINCCFPELRPFLEKERVVALEHGFYYYVVPPGKYKHYVIDMSDDKERKSVTYMSTSENPKKACWALRNAYMAENIMAVLTKHSELNELFVFTGEDHIRKEKSILYFLKYSKERDELIEKNRNVTPKSYRKLKEEMPIKDGGKIRQEVIKLSDGGQEVIVRKGRLIEQDGVQVLIPLEGKEEKNFDCLAEYLKATWSLPDLRVYSSKHNMVFYSYIHDLLFGSKEMYDPENENLKPGTFKENELNDEAVSIFGDFMFSGLLTQWFEQQQVEEELTKEDFFRDIFQSLELTNYPVMRANIPEDYCYAGSEPFKDKPENQPKRNFLNGEFERPFICAPSKSRILSSEFRKFEFGDIEGRKWTFYSWNTLPRHWVEGRIPQIKRLSVVEKGKEKVLFPKESLIPNEELREATLSQDGKILVIIKNTGIEVLDLETYAVIMKIRRNNVLCGARLLLDNSKNGIKQFYKDGEVITYLKESCDGGVLIGVEKYPRFNLKKAAACLLPSGSNKLCETSDVPHILVLLKSLDNIPVEDGAIGHGEVSSLSLRRGVNFNRGTNFDGGALKEMAEEINRGEEVLDIGERIDEFKNKSPRDQMQIIEELGQIGTYDVLPIFEHASGALHSGIRKTAARALRNISPEEEAVILLRKLLDDNVMTVRYEALCSLGDIHTGEAVKLIAAKLGDDTYMVADKAAELLVKHGDKGIRELLNVLSTDCSKGGHRAAAALKEHCFDLMLIPELYEMYYQNSDPELKGVIADICQAIIKHAYRGMSVLRKTYPKRLKDIDDFVVKLLNCQEDIFRSIRLVDLKNRLAKDKLIIVDEAISNGITTFELYERIRKEVTGSQSILIVGCDISTEYFIVESNRNIACFNFEGGLLQIKLQGRLYPAKEIPIGAEGVLEILSELNRQKKRTAVSTLYLPVLESMESRQISFIRHNIFEPFAQNLEADIIRIFNLLLPENFNEEEIIDAFICEGKNLKNGGILIVGYSRKISESEKINLSNPEYLTKEEELHFIVYQREKDCLVHRYETLYGCGVRSDILLEVIDLYPSCPTHKSEEMQSEQFQDGGRLSKTGEYTLFTTVGQKEPLPSGLFESCDFELVKAIANLKLIIFDLDNTLYRLKHRKYIDKYISMLREAIPEEKKRVIFDNECRKFRDDEGVINEGEVYVRGKKHILEVDSNHRVVKAWSIRVDHSQSRLVRKLIPEDLRAKEYPIIIDKQAYSAMVYVSHDMRPLIIIANMLGGRGLSDIHERFKEHICEHSRDYGIHPDEKLCAMLSTLKKQKMKLVVVSNSDEETVGDILGKLDIANYIDEVIGYADKPLMFGKIIDRFTQPRFRNRIMDLLFNPILRVITRVWPSIPRAMFGKVSPGEIVSIGDDIIRDLAPAKRRGVMTVLISDNRKEWKNENVDAGFNNIYDALGLIIGIKNVVKNNRGKPF